MVNAYPFDMYIWFRNIDYGQVFIKKVKICLKKLTQLTIRRLCSQGMTLFLLLWQR